MVCSSNSWEIGSFSISVYESLVSRGGGGGGGGGGVSKYSDYCLSAVEPNDTVCSLLVSQFRPDITALVDWA